MGIQSDDNFDEILKKSTTPVQNSSVTPDCSPALPVSATSSGTSSIIFTSPFEDTSGLDVFAQIAASAHPLPVRRSSATAIPSNSINNTPAPLNLTVPSNTSNTVQQSQSQIAQSIYQTQQALRLQTQQQKRDSIDSTISKFDPKIDDEYDDEFDSDDEDIEFDSSSEKSEMQYRSNNSDQALMQKNNNIGYGNNNLNNNNSNSSKSSLLFTTPIKEETESDLMMDIDQTINFHQRRRSPSLSNESNDANVNNSNSANPLIYARRQSAPENSIIPANPPGGYSARRVIHNICERKRRENIREGFSQLQNRLPAHLANNPKLSKMEILAGARNLINEIRGRISNLTAEVSALTQVSEQIDKKESPALAVETTSSIFTREA